MFSWAATGIITLDDLLQYLHAIVQAMARYSMANLRERLIPCGAHTPAYGPRTGITPREQIQALKTRLHLNSFTEPQPFMELLPLLAPKEEPPVDLPDRVFPVTVISSDGRAKPIKFGLCIEKVRSPLPYTCVLCPAEWTRSLHS